MNFSGVEIYSANDVLSLILYLSGLVRYVVSKNLAEMKPDNLGYLPASSSYQQEYVVDINNLIAFIEVAEKQSFSRSAESLQLTQPAVSKRIAALETELSSRLFDRIGRSVHLTEAGRVLLPSALQISSELSRIEDVICNLGKEVSGKLSIGTTEHVGAHHLAPILKKYGESYPGVNMDVNTANPRETLTKLENGILDIALCSSAGESVGGKHHTRLQDMEIWSERLLLVTSKDHAITRERCETIECIAGHQAILPPEKSVVRNSINEALTQQNIGPVVSIEAVDFQTIKSMTSIGLGWAFIPEVMVDDSLAVIDTHDVVVKNSVALVRNSDRSMSRAAQAFVDALPTRLI